MILVPVPLGGYHAWLTVPDTVGMNGWYLVSTSMTVYPVMGHLLYLVAVTISHLCHETGQFPRERCSEERAAEVPQTGGHQHQHAARPADWVIVPSR
ncbi:hypothetical protein [Mycobacterium gastri]|uniref:Uncharacterized protein n=1 Tax=Mycobacterium gastri TaxID=1777 RepID=A0A1X1VXI4_MYCGS|nr:hypothetical protein [Mycobacterium gastri]ETW25065.1 hypothetical protein MGAST_04895 [Mycobacterium gastri 'Wayne']ORV74452.1 hypothetical protein AWC07_25195 [Mycobacterium gastri]